MNEQSWYRNEDVEGLTADQRTRLTRRHVNPGMVKTLGMLGFDRFWAERAEGLYLDLPGGRRILDMTGGNGVLALGHNHPAILRARERVAREKRLEFCKSFVSPYVAALAANMAALLPGDLEYSFFCGSGAEAVEGALKLAQKHHGPERRGFVYTDQSFHGKSHAAMSVSSLDDSRRHFKLLDHCYPVPYGNAQALDALLRGLAGGREGQQPPVCAFILEAIHGTRLVFPPPGYLAQVRKLCDRYGVLLILDEIYLGFGHTGRMFAFQAEDIVPDIVCYSKSFGGGKASIAGYTARAPVFLRAYGKPGESMMHSSTYSGMTEECATAIEALNVLRDENLVERAREMGEYLGPKLRALQARHPASISDVRGTGLLWGVELRPTLQGLESAVTRLLPSAPPLLSTLAGAVVLAEMFHAHDILAYLGLTRRNLVVISPALIVTREELDRTVDALDAVLARGWTALGQSFLARQILPRSS